jgi:hypothetical protein
MLDAPATPVGLAVWLLAGAVVAVATGTALAWALRGIQWLLIAAQMIAEDWRARPLVRDREMM